MGTFTFRWPHHAEEVYVTGTFDNWSKSEQLVQNGDVFEKTVTLPEDSDKVYYKFVVDGDWTTDHTAPREKDHEGNENNVLFAADITKAPEAAPPVAIMNTVTPESTTAQLAGAVPLESTKNDQTPPGGYPETPAADLNDDKQKEFKINPLPATEGAINPIQLAPGEKIPDEVIAGSINSQVTLDKESYEKSDRIPGLEDIVLPPVTSNMIPESSLPITGGHDFTINSVSPESTTAALAGQVPLAKPEVPEVPKIVKESQEKADFPPEASAISEEVKEKATVEEELLEKVPTAPATSEGTAGEAAPEKTEHTKTLAETVVASGTTAIAAAVGTAFVAKQTATDAAIEYSHKLPESVQHQLPAAFQQSAIASSQEKTLETISPSVPAEVKDSIAEAGTSPEAATNTAAVEEKKEVEAELLKEVKPVEAAAESSTKTTEEVKPAAPPAPTVEDEAPEVKPATNGTTAVVPKAAEVAPVASTTAEPSKAAEVPAATTAEKKKKHRLSAFISKIKHRVSNKDKA
ncbi:hypothetical protein B0T22DRAFT_386081 [Podospora appendiculata]|uniref:AMP-activated protein kinase glycogen-binding domain-containing protein n=1 Tax=Podospora appendiculata TaxID=314037 RepID=A0AAE0X0E2_9PEZI|nr:hypothetical protein B0T22DRAFT_386081 [Podospora appendiculata]